MATAAEVLIVRQNTALVDDDSFNDPQLMALIDQHGTTSRTSAAVWRIKAAAYAELVDTAEAGASHKFSDLYKNAIQMASIWDSIAAGEDEEEAPLTSTRPYTIPISRV